MLYSSELSLHNVIRTPLHLAIPQYDSESTNYSPLNEISDLVNFASNPKASTSNTESHYEQPQHMFPFQPEPDNFAGWAYQSTGTVDQTLPTDQENIFQSIYAPMHGANFSTPSMNMQMYSPPHYSPAPALIPTTPSTTYSSSSQTFLSPWHNSGNISSTPTTPLTMPPVLGARQEQAASAPPARATAYDEQVGYWKDARSLPVAGGNSEFVPQKMYKPHTASDIKRYIEEVTLDPPIIFWMEGPDECGIPLIDALYSRTRRLLDHDKEVFEGRGPSVSIRLEWPGYRQWSRQIPTKDFKSPPRPINMTKLCKNVAKCVQRFIIERQHCELEDGANLRWRVGDSPRHRGIRLEDLVLVSLHHVSMGSWQPQLRLRPRLR
ncbi:hypothetical protein APHAL10511_004413 [Amanita phalloides]|nr:hypothetical protein APHAL10511_004413 [Amanita phalloides]